MTPIHEMKTRKATWDGLDDAPCHGVFFAVGDREVGVVILDQPEAVAKPILEAISALPDFIAALQYIQACKAKDGDYCISCKTRADAVLSKHGLAP